MTFLRIRRCEFSPAVRRAIEARATDESGLVHCERCGVWCKSRSDYEIDHKRAEGLQPIGEKRRKLVAADGELMCLDCHAKKTLEDKGFIAEAKRRELKEPLKVRGKTEIQRRFP